MGFVNEFLTNEEKEETVRTAMFGSYGHRYGPTQWTADRERGIYLVQTRSGTEEDYIRNKSGGPVYFTCRFALSWKGHSIDIVLLETYPNNDALLRWELKEIQLSVELKQNKNEIINDLKDALIVFGFGGNPKDLRNKFAIVEFNF